MSEIIYQTHYSTHFSHGTQNKEECEVQVSDTIRISENTIIHQFRVLTPLKMYTNNISVQ